MKLIHYHGTPVGGSRSDVVRFLRGRHALIPFARPDDLGAALEVCQSVVLDNSAFSLWRAGGGDVNVSAYHAWVHSLAGHPSLDWCLIPDKIDGTESSMPSQSRQEATVQAERPVKDFTLRFTVSPCQAVRILWSSIMGRQIVIRVDQPTVELASDDTVILRSSANG